MKGIVTEPRFESRTAPPISESTDLGTDAFQHGSPTSKTATHIQCVCILKTFQVQSDLGKKIDSTIQPLVFFFVNFIDFLWVHFSGYTPPPPKEGENIVMICQGLPWLFHASGIGIIVSYRASLSAKVANWGGSLAKPPFGVTSAEAVVNSQKQCTISVEIP